MSDEELRYELRSAARWGRFHRSDVPDEARRRIDGRRFREAFDLLDASAISPPREQFAWGNMKDAAALLGLDERAAHYGRCYDRAQEDRATYIDGLFEQIVSVVGSDCSVQQGMSKVIDFCSAAIPDAGWDAFRDPRYLDYERDIAHLAARLESVFGEEPPPGEIDGLWFGLFNPYHQDKPTADMHVAGGVGAFEDPHAWAEDLVWRPRTGRMTRSHVLHAIYWVAYHGEEDDGWTPGLGNDAEHPLCLAYAALVVRWLVTMLPTDLLLAGAPQRLIQVGFDSGDVLTIGTLCRDGLVFPTDGMI